MSLRYGLLSLLAILFILLLISKNFEIWTIPFEAVPEKGATKKPGPKSENPPSITGSTETASLRSFIFVAEKNIFRPDRKDFPVTPDPAKERKAVVRPQIILYGVTIAGSYKSASIAQQGRVLQKGEREIMTIREGDQIGGYKLAKILPERIALETPEDNFEVPLYDANVPKRRVLVKTENKPAMITSTLPVPATTGKPGPAPPLIGRTGAPISGAVVETRVPGPVTPAPMPPVRRRTSGTSVYDKPKAPGEQ